MSRRVVERKWENRNVYLEKGDLLLLLEDPTKPLITARTRHGRNIKVPLSILSRDNIEFECQLCDSGPYPDYASYTAHLIEEHFREQLMTGLDFSSGKSGMPRCPFPVCNGTAWASLQALLMHYASHHHVLEKLMMYESEMQCVKLRSTVKSKEEQISHLKKKVSKMEMLLEEQEVNGKPVKGEKEVRDIEVITGTHLPMKEDVKPDIKKLIKFEVGTVTSIENQTLKKEYLQIKKEKEKIEKALESNMEELDKIIKATKSSQQEYENDLKSATESAKNWKETCLEEQEKFNAEIENLKAQITEEKKEIENLKNIIEIGKSTVENAKQLSTELAKDNQIQKNNSENFRNEIIINQQTIKSLETKCGEANQEIKHLRDLVQYLSDKLETTSKENNDIDKKMEDLNEKYKNLLEVLKRKDGDIESLRSSLENFDTEKESMNTTLEEHMRSWQAEKKAMQTEFRKELEKNSSRLIEQADIIKQKQEEVSVIRLKMEDAKKEARKLSVQVMELKERTAELESYIKTEETAHEKVQTKLQTELQEKEDILKGHKNEKNTMKEENEMLKQNEERLKFEIEVGKAERGDLESRMSELKNGLTAKSRSEDEMKRKVDKLGAQLRVQGWEIDNYKSRLINSEIFISSLGGEETVHEENKMEQFQPNKTEKFNQLVGSPPTGNFFIPSVYSLAAAAGGQPGGGISGAANIQEPGVPTPDPSITSQEEYSESDNLQGSEYLVQVKKEIQFADPEGGPRGQQHNSSAQDFKSWEKRPRNSDSQSKSNKKMKTIN